MNASLWLANIAHILALPPFILFILIGAGLLLARWRPYAGRRLAGASLLLFFFLCTEFGADFLVRPLESRTAPLAWTADGRIGPQMLQPQAIVVLAAGRLEHAPEYGDTDLPDYVALARLRYAARLQHRTGLPLLASGGNVLAYGKNKSKAAAMAEALRDDFRTPVRWVEGLSETTEENARFSAQILRRDGVQRILLVTDAMHMPRAQRVFAQTGLAVTAAPTMFFSGRWGESIASFLPSAEGLRRSYYACYEWLGLLWYGRLHTVAAPG